MKQIKPGYIATKQNDGSWHSDSTQRVGEESQPVFIPRGQMNTLDLHYYFSAGLEPVPGDALRIRLSSSEMANYDSLLLPKRTIYRIKALYLFDTTMCCNLVIANLPNMEFWKTADSIFARFQPINKGLEGFVQNTGMNLLLKG